MQRRGRGHAHPGQALQLQQPAAMFVGHNRAHRAGGQAIKDDGVWRLEVEVVCREVAMGLNQVEGGGVFQPLDHL